MKNNLFSILKERIRMETRHAGLLILDIAILIMCVVVVSSVISVAVSFHEAYDEGYDSEDLYYSLREEKYAQLADQTSKNRMYGMGEDIDLQEYYAVADYYEAAIQYRLCLEAGDADRAETWLAKMNDAERRLGVFSPEKEKLDQMLGIQ